MGKLIKKSAKWKMSIASALKLAQTIIQRKTFNRQILTESRFTGKKNLDNLGDNLDNSDEPLRKKTDLDTCFCSLSNISKKQLKHLMNLTLVFHTNWDGTFMQTKRSKNKTSQDESKLQFCHSQYYQCRQCKNRNVISKRK